MFFAWIVVSVWEGRKFFAGVEVMDGIVFGVRVDYGLCF